MRGKWFLILALVSAALSRCAHAEQPDVTVLCQQLKDERDTVRVAAARALRNAASTDRSIIEALTAALTDPNVDVRRQCLSAIEKMGSAAQSAIPSVIPMLKDKEQSVRICAAQSLGIIAPPLPDAVSALAEALTDTNKDVRVYALEALKKHGPAAAPASPALIHIAMTEKNSEFLNPAIYTLAMLMPPPADAAPVLAAAMLNGNLRSRAAEGLEKIGAAAVAPVAPLISHESVEVRQETARLLAKLLPGAPEAASPLILATRDKDTNTRRSAVQALSKSSPLSPERVSALIPILEDASHDMRAIAASALISTEPKSADLLRALVKARGKNSFEAPLRKELEAVFLKPGKDALPALPLFIEGLSHRDWELRLWSCKVIEGLGVDAKEAIPALLIQLQDRERVMRTAAGDALGAMGNLAADEVVHYMRAERPDVRYAAGHALLRSGETGMAWLKRLLLQDSHPDTRTSAAEVLVELAPDNKAITPFLVQAITNRVNKVRNVAQNSLVKFGPDAVPDLLAAIKISKGDVRPLVESLGRTSPAALPQLIEALNTGDLPVVLASAEALERLGTNVKSAVPSLTACVTRLAPEGEDWQKLCQRITQTLGSVGPDARECIPFLMILAEDKNRSVCASAAYALGKVAVGMEKLPPLAGVIEHGEIDALGTTLRNLGSVGIAALLEALGDDKPVVRQRAALTAYSLGVTSIPALQAALKAERWQTRAGAAMALHEFTNPRAGPKIRPVVAPVIPDLKAAIKDPHPDVCVLAACAARKDADAGENILLVAKAITECSPELRLKAAQMMSTWELDKHPNEMTAAAPYLLKALKDEPREFKIVMRALLPRTKTFTKECAVLLAHAMKEEFPPLRSACVKALEGFGADAADAIPVLVGYLSDAERAMGRASSNILISIGQPAVPALLQALQSEDSKARSLAAVALTKIKPAANEAVPSLIAAMKHPSVETRLAAIQLIIPMAGAAKASAPELIAALQDEAQQIRKAAFDALLAIGNEAAPALLTGAKSDDARLCVNALTVLAKLKPEPNETISVVQPLLESKTLEVRRAAIMLVGAIGPSVPQLIPTMIEALNADEKEIQNAATEAVGQMGAGAIPALLAGTADGNLNLRVRCIRALRSFAATAPPEVLAKLIAAIRDESPEVREAAVTTLRVYKSAVPQVIPEMIILLKDADYTIRRAAIMYMNEHGKSAPNQVVAPLAERLKDEVSSNRRWAAEALRAIGPEARIAAPLIIDALKDPDPRVRKAVIAALVDLGLANDEAAMQGLNEMAIIEFLDKYSATQERFRLKDWDGDGVLEYAQSFKEIENADALIAAAEGNPGELTNYKGYRFKLLKWHLNKANGARKEFINNGNMIGGFAFVAYPAQYDKTGRCTFVATDDGAVYQKDWGGETPALLTELNEFEPEQWTRVKEPLDQAPKVQPYTPAQAPIAQPNIEF